MTQNEQMLAFWLVVSMIETIQTRDQLITVGDKLIDAQNKLIKLYDEKSRRQLDEMGYVFEDGKLVKVSA